MLDISNISPIAFNIFGINIYWYGIAYVIGLWLALWYAEKLSSKFNINIEQKTFDKFFPIACVAIVIGGRLGHVLFFEAKYYFHNLYEIINIRNGGMSFHGGLIGLVIASILFCKTKKIDIWRFTDVLSTVAPIGLGIGRIANFINGELYGKPTDSFFGVLFKNVELYRHPTQIYESLTEGFLTFIILRLCWNKKIIQKKSGIIFSLFLLLYGIFRFSIDFLKESDLYFSLTMGQWLSIFMILFSIVIATKRYTKNIEKL